MKFIIFYKVGSEMRSKNVIAKNLDEAEEVANKKVPRWLEIKIINPILTKWEA